MAFTFKSLLPTPELIKAEFPLSDEAVELKEKRDKEIAAVFTGESDKFLVIIGPCSADREDSVCEYMESSSTRTWDIRAQGTGAFGRI